MSTLAVAPASPGFNPDCGTFYAARPTWLSGYISYADARFLHGAVLREKPALIVEIGSASGFSAAVLCHALEAAARTVGGPREHRVVSFDISERFYADPTRRVGDAAREQLDPGLLEHVEFRNPATAADAAAAFPAHSIGFLFIDACHQHPWPALDLLAVLPIARPGGVVMLHDINLPSIGSGQPIWGAHHLFFDLDLEKLVPADPGEVPNVGQVRVPRNKSALRRRLLALINAHPWETAVPDDYLARLGLVRDGDRLKFLSTES